MPSARTSSVIDSGALAALLDPREEHHDWAVRTFAELPPPWLACEAVLSETLFLVSEPHAAVLLRMLREGEIRVAFDLGVEMISVLELMDKYTDVPMSLADACLVRMSETLPNPVIVTTDTDFRIYRRHGRRVVPVLMP